MDFEKHHIYSLISKQFRLTTIRITYYLPDYENLVDDFIWQTMDLPPEYPRMRKFINYWKKNIDSEIRSIDIYASTDIPSDHLKYVDRFFNL